MKIIFQASVLVLLSSSFASAACNPAQQFLSCKIEGKSKWLEVCVEGGNIAYRFGPQGKPELALVERSENVAYMPWPGIGRSIWEEVEFSNNGHIYRVFGAIDKQLAAEGAPGATSGGVEVLKGDQSLVTLMCDPKQITFDWNDAMMNAKTAIGMTWDPSTQMWQHGQ